MAHMVETMAYAGERPWHGLGVEVSPELTPDEMMQAAGLNWEVVKVPLRAIGPDGSLIPVKEHFALVRTSDNKALDVVGNLFTPVQNRDAFTFFNEFVKAGDMQMQTAGSLSGGRRIWALASIRAGFTLPGGDRVEGFLLLCSPHIQGEALSIKFTGIRVVCNNTLQMALRGNAGFRMAHWSRFDESTQETAKLALGLATEKLDMMRETAELLASTPAKEDKMMEFVYRVSGSKLIEMAVEETAAVSGNDALSAVLAATERAQSVKSIREADLNKVGKTILDSILTSPGSDLASAKGTWWGAINGVTHAIDHRFGRNRDSGLDQSWFGHRAAMKTKALDLAVEYAQAARQ